MEELDLLLSQTAAAQTAKAEFDEIPSGNYICEIEEAKIDETGKYGLRVTITMRITEGDFAKRKVWHNYNLNEKGVPYMKADLLKLGKTANTRAELESSLESLLGSHVEIFLKYKDVKNELTGVVNRYKQVFVNGLQSQLPF